MVSFLTSLLSIVFFFKQKTAYEMRISDWSSDVCSSDLQATLSALLKTQLAVSVVDANGKLLDATGVQIPGVLDDRFGFDGQLGAVYGDDAISLRLWAPTAQSARLLLFDDSDPASEPVETRDLHEDIANGVWQISGPLAWARRYYQFEVSVFAPSTGKKLARAKCRERVGQQL